MALANVEALKYYFLECYLFDDVNKNFQKNGCLTSEEFFAIVIWKSNRAKTIVRKGIGKSGKTVSAITSEVSRAKTRKDKLEALRKIRGIGIPMASAILTVCYPDDFTLVDYRARTALKDYFGAEIMGNPTVNPSAYFEYLDKCKELANENNLSLRNFDRILLGRYFYEGKNGLKHLAERTD